jgi:transposase
LVQLCRTRSAALAVVRSGEDLRPRPCAPGYGYYSGVKDRYDANRACLSQARRIVRHTTQILSGLGDDAFAILAQPTAPTTIAR